VAAFVLPPGPIQYTMILAGVFVAGAHTGAAGAVIGDVTHPGLRATAFATIVLGNNLIGLSPGPVVVGALSDAYGLRFALGIAPLSCLVAAGCFLYASRSYPGDSGRYEEPADSDTAPAPLH
jgi:MFS family permease